MDADQAFKRAGQIQGYQAAAWVSVMTQQSNGIATYAAGRVEYHHGTLLKRFSAPARFAGQLTFLYSDRTHPETLLSPQHAEQVKQPFSVHSPNKLDFRLARTLLFYPTVELTALDGSGTRYRIRMEQRGGVLIGTGPPAGNLAAEAVYVVTFTDVFRARPPGVPFDV